MSLSALMHEIERLPVPERWQLVKLVLDSLEQEQRVTPPDPEWRQFLQDTYGSLHDTPLQRWPQGDYEDREPLV